MRIGRTLPPAAAPIGIADVLSGIAGILRGRKELERFRSELKQHFGVKHCFLVSSGKAAFALILLALRELFPGRDEVLIPAFTCYSVPSSIVRAGLKVRLCDLSPDRLDFDFVELPAMLSDKLLAVVPTHLFGSPSDLPGLRQLIQDPAITIVEDAAQAMGETWEGKELGTLGDVGFLSLGRGKAFSAVEGGVILTTRDDIAQALSRRVAGLPGYGLRKLIGLVSKAAAMTFFTHPPLFWIPRCMPFLRLGETLFEPDFPMLRMSSFQAGLTANWRERLQSMRDARRTNVRRWMELLEETGNRGICSHLLPQPLGLLRFPIRVRDSEKRKTLLHESANKGVGVMSVYPESINRLTELRGEIPAQACPVAESCARELVTLPTHPFLTQKDVTVLRQLLAPALAVRG